MIEEFKLLKYTILIFKPDPCKKCLVKACCTRVCKEKQDLEYFLGNDSIKSKRYVAILLWFTIIYFLALILFTWVVG
jgi:hypothetical protein